MPLKDSNEAADVTLLLRVDATKATFYGCAESLTFGNTAVLLVYPVKVLQFILGLVFVTLI